nr:hypothetical protein [Tanacetum cinerariifolium]
MIYFLSCDDLPFVSTEEHVFDHLVVGQFIHKMASSSCSSPICINFHYDRVFEANPINYEFDMVSKLDNVDIYAMDYSAFVTYLETISHAMSNALYFVVPGLDLKNGLSSLKNAYMAHSKFAFDDRIIEDNHHSGSHEDDYGSY